MLEFQGVQPIRMYILFTSLSLPQIIANRAFISMIRSRSLMTKEMSQICDRHNDISRPQNSLKRAPLLAFPFMPKCNDRLPMLGALRSRGHPPCHSPSLE